MHFRILVFFGLVHWINKKSGKLVMSDNGDEDIYISKEEDYAGRPKLKENIHPLELE